MRFPREVLDGFDGIDSMMGVGPTALFMGILVTVIPFSFLLRLLQQLPKALVQSHKRWPLIFNGLVTAGVTSVVTLFLHRAADRSHGLPQVALEFLIAAVVYAFGLVLVLRQFCGVYEEFIITVIAAGLALRKTSYANIVKAEGEDKDGGETQILIETSRGILVKLIIPTRDADRFYTHVRKKRSIE
jgi:fucose 4-O-acetylase-like acetyltransferase